MSEGSYKPLLGKRLRARFCPRGQTHVANQPRIGYANAESARMLLGTVAVEEDGSAYFRAPVRIVVLSEG